MPSRILIWGAGAIGGTLGAHLARAGHDISFVDADAAHVDAMRDPARGLTITGPISTFTVKVPAYRPDEVPGTWERIFLAVKAQHTQDAAQALAPHLAADGFVLSLQNGLCEDVIASVVGRERTVGAFINYGADWQAPGEIEFANRGAFVVGELDGRRSQRIEALHAIVKDFEPDAIITDDIHAYLWGKLGYMAMLTAQGLGQLGTADCLDRPELLPLWRQIGLEINSVAQKLGITPRGFNGYDPQAFMPGAQEAQAKASTDAMVAFNRPSTKTHSGVWRDLAIRKRSTEADVHLMPVVRMGATFGIACPTLAKLVAMIKEVEAGTRPMVDDNLLELARA